MVRPNAPIEPVKETAGANDKLYSIVEAAAFMNVTQAYVRTLVRQKKLATEMVPIAEGSAVYKHVISGEEIAQFLAVTTRKARRTDGRNKYVFYATPGEYILVDDALRKTGLAHIADMTHTANILKPGRSIRNG